MGFTGRKEIQFTYDVNTHRALEFVGGKTDVKRDIANMGRVVQEERTLDGGSIDIITGPGPQAAARVFVMTNAPAPPFRVRPSGSRHQPDDATATIVDTAAAVAATVMLLIEHDRRGRPRER